METGEWTALAVIFALMVLFVPNAGRRGLFFVAMDELTRREKEKLKEKEQANEEERRVRAEARRARRREAIRTNKGDMKTVLAMINRDIKRGNKFWENKDPHHRFIKEPVTSADPYKTYIFHGGCHSCRRPQIDSVTGCYTCQYYSVDWKRDESLFME